MLSILKTIYFILIQRKVYILLIGFILNLGCLALEIDEKTFYSVRDISSHSKENDQNPNFSPNGRYLAYVRLSTEITETWILDLKTHREKRVEIVYNVDTQPYGTGYATNNYSTELSWSPCSRFFVFSSKGDIYLGSMDMDYAFRLTNNPAIDGEPKWSPDGRYIAFVSARNKGGDIYLIDIKKILDDMLNSIDSIESYDISDIVENQLIPLTRDSKENYSISWSPDGKAIAYQSRSKNPKYPEGMETFNIMVIYDIDKITKDNPSKPVFLTDWFRFVEMYPSWSPKYADNTEYIAFYSNMINGDIISYKLYNEEKKDKSDSRFMLYRIKIDHNELKKLDENTAFVRVDEAIEAILMKNMLINIDEKHGPRWNTNSAGIIYTKMDSDKKNPIYYVDIENKEPSELKCGTLWNESVTINGSKIAFIANEPNGYGKCLYFSALKGNNK